MFFGSIVQFCGKDTNIQLTEGESREITSFNYPGYNPYQGRYQCLVNVAAPDGHQIRVKFNEVHLMPRLDILSLNKNIYSSYDTPEEDLITKGNFLEIGYYTTGSLTRGFSLVVSDYLLPGEKTNRKANKPTQ